VGSEVLKQATAAKLKVRAVYLSADKAKGAPPGVETVLMDYGKPITIRAALEGIEKDCGGRGHVRGLHDPDPVAGWMVFRDRAP
jgi:uncharacterized protein YbjT (DUF2867 family)